jgi:hypothetical protein
MRHGIAGIHGNRGIVESASCRIYKVVSGSNPTLSANSRFFLFNNLAGYALERRSEMGALGMRGQRVRIVGRARQQDRRVLRPLR